MAKLSAHLSPALSDFGLGERSITVATDNAVPWIEWDENRSFCKPTLLNLGGNKTESPKQANGYIKEFQKLIPYEELSDIQIVSAYYRVPDRSLPLYLAPELIKNKTFDFHHEKINRFKDDIFMISEPAFPYAERLYQTYIEPMLVNPITNKRLEFSKALKNMRNLNIATHSFGDYFAVKLSDVMYEKMLKAGFSEKDTADIMKQVAVLTLGGPTVLGQKSRFTTLNVFSTRDEIASFLQSSSSWNKYLSDLFNVYNDNQGTFIPFSNNEAALVINRFYKSSLKPNEQSEHGLVFFDIDNKKVTTSAANTKLLYRNYLTNILANSIQNANENSWRPLPSFNNLLRAPKYATLNGLEQLQAALFLENAIKAGQIDYNNRCKLLQPHTETKFPLSAALQKKLDSLKR